MKKTSFLNSVILTVFAVLLKVTSVAQHQEIGEKPGIWKIKQQQMVDSNSILYAFKHGTTNGHLRYFFMNTNNADGLTDYYAHAA